MRHIGADMRHISAIFALISAIMPPNWPDIGAILDVLEKYSFRFAAPNLPCVPDFLL